MRPMISSLRLAARIALVATLSVTIGNCGGDSTGPAPETPVATSISIDPESPSLTALGATLQLNATVRDQSGNVMAGATVGWTSSATTVASVSSNGLLTALSVGTATITASAGSATQTASLDVRQVVSSVSVTPADATIGPSETAQFEATALDANANPVADASLSWTTGDPNVATVTASGLVRGVAPGTTTVVATGGNVQGSSVVTVLAPPVTSVTITGRTRVKVGDTYGYTVTARLADGTVVNRPVTWGVLEAGQGTITQDGQLTPLASGTVTLLVSIDGVVWQADVLAYDWQVLSGSTSSFLVLDADVEVTNKFGSSEYPELVFACNTTTQNVFAWVDTERFVTASGLVTYRFDEGSFVNQTWIEFDNFSALGHPGPTNLQTKNFALAMAGARVFGFAFTEFQGPARATLFRVTGLDGLLPSLLALCPSNAVVAGAPEFEQARAVSEWRALNASASATSKLRTAWDARRSVGAAPTNDFPELVIRESRSVEIRATRRGR